ncbi:MAG TPA: hypothetical protein VGH70_08685 [Bradyrhizobium sp.]|jgi:hypothetical protein
MLDPVIHSAQNMPSSRQPDLFHRDEQSDLLGEDVPTPEYRPDPDAVHAELHKILAEARAAEKLTWEPKTVLLYRTIFPQMTNWLPDEEAAQLRFEFEAEMKRLEQGGE